MSISTVDVIQGTNSISKEDGDDEDGRKNEEIAAQKVVV